MSNSSIERQITLHKKFAEKYYNVIKENLLCRKYNELWNKTLLNLAPQLQPSANVLEIMCGTGNLLFVLSKNNENIFGLDLSMDMLNFAKLKLSSPPPPTIHNQDAYESRDILTNTETHATPFRLIAGDVCKLPFKKESFDVVFCRAGLHHIPQLNECFFAIKQTIKQGGYFIFSEACNDLWIIRKLREKIYKKLDFFDEETEKGLITNEVKKILFTSGFKVEKIEKLGHLAYSIVSLVYTVNVDFLNKLTNNRLISSLLIKVDQFLYRFKIPVLRNWGTIVNFRCKVTR